MPLFPESKLETQLREMNQMIDILTTDNIKLNDRITKLEADTSYLPDEISTNPAMGAHRIAHYPLKSMVYAIMDHLNLKPVFVRGRPDGYEIKGGE